LLNLKWKCPCCDQDFSGLPLDYNMAVPEDIIQIPREHWDGRAMISRHFCWASGKYFTRGLIELPVIGTDRSLNFGAWVGVSQEDAEFMTDVWHDGDCSKHGPFKGKLRSNLRLNDRLIYGETLDIDAELHLRDDVVPLIKLLSADHPLAVDQRNGITIDRVVEIASTMLPRH